MPWRPLPRIAVAIAIYPFAASSPADLPLEIGDDLYIIEEGGKDGDWFRGYLVAPPSLLAGLTSVKGQTLEARVFSGIFPKCCVEIREHLGDNLANGHADGELVNGDVPKSDPVNGNILQRRTSLVHRPGNQRRVSNDSEVNLNAGSNGDHSKGLLTSKRLPTSASQTLARKLSTISVTSSQSRNSPVPMPGTPTIEGFRDPNSKRPQAPVPMLKIGDETPTSAAEPLVDEIASCLREWHSKNLHELLLARQYMTLDRLSELVNRLNVARRQLLHGVLTDQELWKLREEIVWDLVGGNKMLSDEIIVRDPKQYGRLLTGEDSPIELSKLQATMSLLDRPPTFQHDPISLDHLLVELKGFGYNGLISPTISLQLFAQAPGQSPKPLTECFSVDIPADEDFDSPTITSKMCTLFTDLTANDVDATRSGNEIYLVIRVQASQPIQEISNRRDENANFSRPQMNGMHSGKVPTKGGGRQSLMWASKQFGSVRNRNHASRPSQSSSSAESQAPNAIGTRPSSARPMTGDSAHSASQQGMQYVKKKVGAGVLNLKQILRQGAVAEHQVSIWSPAVALQETPLSTDDYWNELIRDLVSSKSGLYDKARGIEHVRLAIQSFNHPNAEELISKTPTALQNAIPTPKLAFSGTPSKPRSDIYVNILEADLPHHALLSHPEHGTFHLSKNLDLKNVQLTLEVRKGNGARIDRCIYPNSSGPGQTAWRTTAVARGERWAQLIKLVIPTEDVPDAHLIMSIADAPGFPFALSWMPLWNEGAFVRDGKHAPLLYLYDKVTSGTEHGRGAYLSYPWDSKGKGGSERDEFVIGPIASLRLETNLCSTYFSQDKILLGIINWRQLPGNMILDILTKFAFVPEIEIVKMIGNVFDALFGILGDHSGKEEFEDAIFNALVTVLGIVYDRRFNLGPFVDEYAETRFDHPHATSCLIRSYLRLLANPADASQSRRLRATFKVGRQVLKFILCAREQQGLQEAIIGTTTVTAFKRDLKSIFDSLENLMRDPSPILIGSKTLVVQHMPTWLPALKESNAFTEEQILGAASSFIDSCADVQGKLLLYKLILILELNDTKLFGQSVVRKKVVQHTPKWINSYWGFSKSMSEQWREQIRLCSSIVSRQISEPGFEGSDYLGKVIQSYNALNSPSDAPKDTLSLLFPTTYPFPSKPTTYKVCFDESRTELASLLAKLTDTTFKVPINSPLFETAAMVSATLDAVISILSGNAFPTTWLSLYVYHHRAMLQMLESIFSLMISTLIPSPEDADRFNTELWSKFLLTLLTLVRSDTLALETFPEQKRRAVWKIAGDVREQGASLLKRSWEAIGWDTSPDEQQRYGLSRLGGYQVQYVPKLVAPIIELCLSVHEGLRSIAVKILQAMIISEWTLNEDLSVIQAEMIDSLDFLFKTKSFGESMVQKMFVNELLDSFETLARMPLDPLWQAVRDMVSTVDELLELLASVHSPNITENLRIMNTLQLMSFLKDMQKEDIFIRYVHHLADVQARLGNKTEAGLALALHAEQYSWDNSKLAPISQPPYPEQTSFERKERLYFDMVSFFEEGTAWDSALDSYRELANQYEFSHYDFAKLARTQRSMATIYESISKGEWQPPRYFRVTYQGQGFPSTLRGRQFIYEGEPSERQAAFIDRMRQLHPAAQILHKGTLDEADAEADGQYLQIFPVSTYRDLVHPIYQQPRVTQATRDYVTGTKPYRFAVTSKRHSPASDIATQWVEKTVYTTTDAFPTILRRSEIIAIDIIRLSPLETAVERTSRKTSELVQLEKRVVPGDEASYQSLTDAIQSSVDPISISTVSQYRKLLPQGVVEENDSDEEPTEVKMSPMQSALQIALLDHVSILKHSLTQFSDSTHQSAQEVLSQMLHSTFALEIASLTPPPPTEADTVYQLLSSPPGTAQDDAASIVAPLATNAGLHATNPDQSSIENRPKTLNRLSLQILKGSFGSNTSDSKTSKQHISQLMSSSGSVRQPSSQNMNGSLAGSSEEQIVSLGPSSRYAAHIHAPGSREAMPHKNSDERPVTSQSSRSTSTGKVKKRLSLLSMSIGRSGSGSREGSNGHGVDVIQE